jgi:hypothetical protein
MKNPSRENTRNFKESDCAIAQLRIAHSRIPLFYQRYPNSCVLPSGEKAVTWTESSRLSSFCFYSITYSKDKMVMAPEARPIAIEAPKVE